MEQQNSNRPESDPVRPRLSSNEQLLSQGAKSDGLSETHRSPLRLFLITIIAIFMAEVVAMIVVYFIEPLPYHLTTVIDAGIMTILIFPVLYYFSFRPLIRQMQKSWQAEESLRQLSRIVEQTEDTVVVTNRDGVIEYVNPAFERRTGYTKEEALGRTPNLLKSGIHNRAFYNKLWNTVLQGEVFQSEIANRKKNRELFYEVKTITPLRDAEGNITHFVATGKDITEHKQDEEQLQKAYVELELRVEERTEALRLTNAELEEEVRVRRETEEALRLSEFGLKRAQEIAHLGNWELDLVNNRLTWSDEVYRIFGLQPQEFRASYEAFLEIIHPDDRSAVDEAYSASVRDGKEGYEIEHRLIRRSTGEIRVVHEKCEHFRNETGEIIRSVGMVHDITERKQAEEQLHYQAALISNVNDAIVAADARYRLTAWNSGAESLYGWTAEEVLGRSGVEIIRTEWENKDSDEMRRTIAETGRWRGEATQMRKDGTRFPVEVSSIVLHDDRGQITGYISVNRDITQRKSAEEALQLSKENFSKAFRSSPAALMITRLTDGQFMELNDAYCRIVGYDRSELIGHRTTDFNIFIQVPDRQSIVDRLIQAKSIRDFETSIRHRSGAIRQVVAAQELITFNGEPCILSSLEDITERKRAEETIRAARDQLELRVQERTTELAIANKELMKEITERREIERQLRIQTTAMEAAANGIIITDRQGNIQWTNPALVQISGYEAPALLGKKTHIFKSGQHASDYYRQMWDTILSGQVWRGEITNRRKDGSFYVEEQTITPVRDDQGQISQFIAIKQDITERKQAEEALRESEEKFRTLVEWTYDWEIWLDPCGKIIYNSPACERMTGYQPEEFMATPDLMTRIIHPDDRGVYQEHQRLLHDETVGPETLQYRILTRDGCERWIEHVCRPLFGADNRYLGRRMSNRDITEKKQAEKDIQERNQKEKILTQTIHTMQLDIARDLHDTIGQNISFLRMKLDYLAQKQIRKRAELQAELRSMAQVANESYDLMRGTLAVLQSESSTDLFRLFSRYAQQIEERSAFKIKLSTQGEARFMSAKRMRHLFYVFREILNNIEKHAKASEVCIEMAWDHDRLNLVVYDNGSGFDMDKVQYGSHYGLKFMRERVELLNGSLLIRSAAGSGTNIMLQVPYE